jgi:hypothetical protein
MDGQDTTRSQLSGLLEQVRALAEQVRIAADRVHIETEEAHRLAAVAYDQAESTRELRNQLAARAHQVRGSIERTLENAQRNNSRKRR